MKLVSVDQQIAAFYEGQTRRPGTHSPGATIEAA